MLPFNSIVSKRCLLIADQRCISSIEGQQLLMRAPVHEKVFIKHQDQIGIANCAQPVSDHDSCTGEITQNLINDAFSYGVQITGRLIKL